MRISDWSSDVCSSDLPVEGDEAQPEVLGDGADGEPAIGFVVDDGGRDIRLRQRGAFAERQIRGIDTFTRDQRIEQDAPARTLLPRRDPGLFRHQIRQVAQAERIASGDDEALIALRPLQQHRSEEHTSELQSLMSISYAVFCLTTKTN